MRLALIFMLADGTDRLTERHLIAASALVDWSAASIEWILNRAGTASMVAYLNYLADMGIEGADARELGEEFGSQKSRDLRDESIAMGLTVKGSRPARPIPQPDGTFRTGGRRRKMIWHRDFRPTDLDKP
jgi:hypothetical protein